MKQKDTYKNTVQWPCTKINKHFGRAFSKVYPSKNDVMHWQLPNHLRHVCIYLFMYTSKFRKKHNVIGVTPTSFKYRPWSKIFPYSSLTATWADVSSNCELPVRNLLLYIPLPNSIFPLLQLKPLINTFPSFLSILWQISRN